MGNINNSKMINFELIDIVNNGEHRLCFFFIYSLYFTFDVIYILKINKDSLKINRNLFTAHLLAIIIKGRFNGIQKGSSIELRTCRTTKNVNIPLAQSNYLKFGAPKLLKNFGA